MSNYKENEYTILIVDDLPENIYAFEAVLSEENYILLSALNGQKALSLALKYHPHLILLDVQMPDIDGFEVAEILKKTEVTKDIPVVFITAISKDVQYINRGYELGAENYIFKPIDPDMLRIKIRHVLKYHEYIKEMSKHELRREELRQRILE